MKPAVSTCLIALLGLAGGEALAEVAERGDCAAFVFVQPGDNLVRLFGRDWEAVRLANRQVAWDPRLVPVGALLCIPQGVVLPPEAAARVRQAEALRGAAAAALEAAEHAMPQARACPEADGYLSEARARFGSPTLEFRNLAEASELAGRARLAYEGCAAGARARGKRGGVSAGGHAAQVELVGGGLDVKDWVLINLVLLLGLALVAERNWRRHAVVPAVARPPRPERPRAMPSALKVSSRLAPATPRRGEEGGHELEQALRADHEVILHPGERSMAYPLGKDGSGQLLRFETSADLKSIWVELMQRKPNAGWKKQRRKLSISRSPQLVPLVRGDAKLLVWSMPLMARDLAHTKVGGEHA